MTSPQSPTAPDKTDEERATSFIKRWSSVIMKGGHETMIADLAHDFTALRHSIQPKQTDEEAAREWLFHNGGAMFGTNAPDKEDVARLSTFRAQARAEQREVFISYLEGRVDPCCRAVAKLLKEMPIG